MSRSFWNMSGGMADASAHARSSPPFARSDHRAIRAVDASAASLLYNNYAATA